MSGPSQPRMVALEPRVCDICGSDDLHPVWRQHHVERLRDEPCLWDIQVVVCSHCGFAFVSPAPTFAELHAFYAKSLSTFVGQDSDFSIDTRMRLLRRMCAAGGSYVEIGSNEHGAFSQALAGHFAQVRTFEINEGTESSVRDMAHLPDGEADIVASYFVLEHVVHTGPFMDECKRLLRPGTGKLLIEVPNAWLYSQEPASLLIHEHVNHFTPNSLIALARRHGLALETLSIADCSRSYGFVAVFSVAPESAAVPAADPIEVASAKACILGGVQRVTQLDEDVANSRAVLAAETRPTVVWGANAICLRLLENWSLPSGAVLVDSDPRKADFFPGHRIHVPGDMVETIKQAGAIVICTRRHAAAIRQWIALNAPAAGERSEIILDF